MNAKKRKQFIIICSLIVILGFGYKIETLSSIDVEQRAEIEELRDRLSEIDDGETESALTGAVSRVSPAVVSIDIVRKRPDFNIFYQKLIGGDDSFFGSLLPNFDSFMEEEKIGAGSGFFVHQDGFILTNRHVVADSGALYIVRTTDGKEHNAKVAYLGKKDDLALLKIDGGRYPIVKLGNSEDLKLGQSVFAVGNALGEYGNSVSRGIISGLDREIEAYTESGDEMEKLSGVLQTDAAINLGNSGGPLVNMNGEVIGINVATVVGSNNVSFAMPINRAKEIIKAVFEES